MNQLRMHSCQLRRPLQARSPGGQKTLTTFPSRHSSGHSAIPPDPPDSTFATYALFILWTLAPAFRLPTFPVACRDDAGVDVAQRRSSWKLTGVIATVQADPRPFVWIDDVEIPRSTEEHFDHLGVPSLCVRPHPHHGLSDRHMRDVDAFLADHS